MSILEQLASSMKHLDDVPNQELARKIAYARDEAAVQELVDNLVNRDRAICSDCIKVLYEIGYLDAALISGHAEAFLKQLDNRNNRMVWGAMIALSSIARLRAETLFAHLDQIRKAMHIGSVITVDNGIKILAEVAAARREYNAAVFPELVTHLKTCRPKEVGQHAEKILAAVNRENKADYIAALHEREAELTPAQSIRVNKVIRKAEEC